MDQRKPDASGLTLILSPDPAHVEQSSLVYVPSLLAHSFTTFPDRFKVSPPTISNDINITNHFIKGYGDIVDDLIGCQFTQKITIAG